MNVAIVDSGGANIASIIYAFQRLGVKAELTSDADFIKKSSHVVLPGVGAAPDAMKTILGHNLLDTLHHLRQPVLGICLGMQILYTHSAEGDVDTLDILTGNIHRFPKNGLPVPHMGWNTLHDIKTHPLTAGLDNGAYVYYVHSYYATADYNAIASSNYGRPFAGMVAYENFMGCQFHPEKSGETGAQILQNFLHMD